MARKSKPFANQMAGQSSNPEDNLKKHIQKIIFPIKLGKNTKVDLEHQVTKRFIFILSPSLPVPLSPLLPLSLSPSLSDCAKISQNLICVKKLFVID
jgi:hypothetical protein